MKIIVQWIKGGDLKEYEVSRSGKLHDGYAVWADEAHKYESAVPFDKIIQTVD